MSTDLTPAPQPNVGLWTQAQAADYLNVSIRYLRDSACPKVHLPGHGRRGRPLVRYNPKDVAAWAERWRTNRGRNG